MKLTNTHLQFQPLHRSKRVLGLIGSGLAIGLLAAIPLVRADSYQQQINALNAQNSQAQSVLNSLQSTATSYQGVISQLQSQIAAINNSIAVNQATQNADTAKIAADQVQIDSNKKILADDITTMYEDGQMSTIEELAGSQNLSDYVDAAEYRGLIQNKVTSLLGTIQSLQAQAQAQKVQITALLKTETAQQSQVSADEAQETALLGENQAQQAQFNQQIAANNASINALKAAQAAANASIASSVRVAASGSGSGGACNNGSGTGGYPENWCSAAQDSITDSNGFPNRECTSFAYWYFTSVEKQAGFQVTGNAGWWWENSNFPVTTYPSASVGAIGVEPSSSLDAPVPSLHGGYYGHVMIVLALPGTTYNGSLPYTSAAAGTYVPQGDVLVMSMNEDEAGHFMYNLWPANYLMYINPS